MHMTTQSYRTRLKIIEDMFKRYATHYASVKQHYAKLSDKTIHPSLDTEYSYKDHVDVILDALDQMLDIEKSLRFIYPLYASECRQYLNTTAPQPNPDLVALVLKTFAIVKETSTLILESAEKELQTIVNEVLFPRTDGDV